MNALPDSPGNILKDVDYCLITHLHFDCFSPDQLPLDLRITAQNHEDAAKVRDHLQHESSGSGGYTDPDIVCFEHGYSIIERKPYADRIKRTEYPKRHTVRNEIRSVLDDLIRRKPKDWEKFLRLLAEEGFEIKRGKNIAIKGRAQQRFVRLRSLGEDYT